MNESKAVQKRKNCKFVNSKNSLLALVCDIDRANGESALAQTFLKIVTMENDHTSISVLSYTNHKNFFWRNCLGDYARYLWLWKSLFVARWIDRSQRLLVINYLPIWNFITFVLVPKEAWIAPLTGSILFLEPLIVDRSLKNRLFLRLRWLLIRGLSEASRAIICLRGLRVVGATPSVGKFLGFRNTTLPAIWLSSDVFEYLEKMPKGNMSRSEPSIKFVVYTNSHPLKNNDLLFDCLHHIDSLGIVGALIAPEQFRSKLFANIKRYSNVSKHEMFDIIGSAEFAIQLSFEEAGLFAYEASCLGLKVIGFENTGCALLPGFEELKRPSLSNSLIALKQEIVRILSLKILASERQNIAKEAMVCHEEATKLYRAYFK